jgi:hypothetical protein
MFYKRAVYGDYNVFLKNRSETGIYGLSSFLITCEEAEGKVFNKCLLADEKSYVATAETVSCDELIMSFLNKTVLVDEKKFILEKSVFLSCEKKLHDHFYKRRIYNTDAYKRDVNTVEAALTNKVQTTNEKECSHLTKTVSCDELIMSMMTKFLSSDFKVHFFHSKTYVGEDYSQMTGIKTELCDYFERMIMVKTHNTYELTRVSVPKLFNSYETGTAHVLKNVVIDYIEEKLIPKIINWHWAYHFLYQKTQLSWFANNFIKTKVYAGEKHFSDNYITKVATGEAFGYEIRKFYNTFLYKRFIYRHNYSKKGCLTVQRTMNANLFEYQFNTEIKNVLGVIKKTEHLEMNRFEVATSECGLRTLSRGVSNETLKTNLELLKTLSEGQLPTP